MKTIVKAALITALFLALSAIHASAQIGVLPQEEPQQAVSVEDSEVFAQMEKAPEPAKEAVNNESEIDTVTEEKES